MSIFTFIQNLFVKKNTCPNDELAITIFNNMNSLRKEWLTVCYRHINMIKEDYKSKNINIEDAKALKITNDLFKDADKIICSFQLTHILAYIFSRNFLDEVSYNNLLNKLLALSFNNEVEKYLELVKYYEQNKAKYKGEDFNEQIIIFSEDVAIALIGNTNGHLFKMGVLASAMEFLKYNLEMINKIFKDKN